MIVKIKSGVTGRIIATHCEPFGDVAHPHVWDVEVVYLHKFDAPPVDARGRCSSLDRAIAQLGFDLAAALGERATNEGIACWLLSRLHLDGAIEVGVRRPWERSFAIASAA